MSLSNSERQQRWQAKHLIKLTAPAAEIAAKLRSMSDQVKLRAVHAALATHLGEVALQTGWERDAAQMFDSEEHVCETVSYLFSTFGEDAMRRLYTELRKGFGPRRSQRR
jgi:hypothetical protein